MDSFWFHDLFGFDEQLGHYDVNRSKFKLIGGPAAASLPSPAPCLSIRSLANNSVYECGPFECLSVRELRQRLQGTPPCSQLGCLSFKHIVGDAMKLHRDPANAGGVFQAASQFNALEMVDPGVSPDHGITGYFRDHTQGPACALSCPSATVYRNYLHGGYGQGSSGCQINLMEEVEKMLAPRTYWRMKNGYLLPTDSSSLKALSTRLSESPDIHSGIRDEVKVACQWDTEVWDSSSTPVERDTESRKDPQKVMQVFCSACPVSYTRIDSAAWEPIARACLEAAFEGTLLAAACLSRHQKRRVKVFLTNVGGGAFGNRLSWIKDAVKRALEVCREESLEVFLVHFGHLPEDLF